MEKPRLPSIKLMLEGFSSTEEEDLEKAPPSRLICHRRHASDQQFDHSMLPPLKEVGLSQKVAALTISPMEPRVRSAEKWPLLRPAHARSYSDYTQPRSAFRRLLPSEAHHRRAISSNTASDFMSSFKQAPDPSTSSSTSTTSRMPITPTTDNESSQDGDSDASKEDDEDTSSGRNDNSSNNSNKPENRFKCTYCQKAFSRPSSLRIHVYSHTGERPFVCSEPSCGRKFSVQSNLRRHLKIHSKNRSARYAKKQFVGSGRTVPIAPAS